MSLRTRSFVGVLVLAAAPMLSSCTTMHGDPTYVKLDGRNYKIMITAPSGERKPDNLFFRNGRFESAAETTAGSGPAPYHVESVRDQLKFYALLDNPTTGRSRWIGYTRENLIEGTITRTPNSGSPADYRFSGWLEK